MKNFKEIAEKVLSGELKGTFVLRSGCTRNSSELSRNNNGLTETFPYYLIDNGTLTENGTAYEKVECEYDVVDFIIEDIHTMTDEEINEKSLEYRNHAKEYGESFVVGYDRQLAFIAGAHSRDEEIEKLKNYIKQLQGMLSDMHDAYFKFN